MRVCASYSSGCQLVAFTARPALPLPSHRSHLTPWRGVRSAPPRQVIGGRPDSKPPRRRPGNSPPPGSANEAEAHRGISPSPRHRRPHPQPLHRVPQNARRRRVQQHRDHGRRGGRTPRPRARSNLRACFSRKRSSRAAPSTRPPQTTTRVPRACDPLRRQCSVCGQARATRRVPASSRTRRLRPRSCWSFRASVWVGTGRTIPFRGGSGGLRQQRRGIRVDP